MAERSGTAKRTSPTGKSGSNADERNRTSTGFYSHKNLNLARLPVPPHPQGRPESLAGPRDSAKPKPRLSHVQATPKPRPSQAQPKPNLSSNASASPTHAGSSEQPRRAADSLLQRTCGAEHEAPSRQPTTYSEHFALHFALSPRNRGRSVRRGSDTALRLPPPRMTTEAPPPTRLPSPAFMQDVYAGCPVWLSGLAFRPGFPAWLSGVGAHAGCTPEPSAHHPTVPRE
jgi:hypothetical protein